MSNKTCLITGGNAGIGRAAALSFAKLGYTVLIGCRDVGRGTEAQNSIREQSANNQVFFCHLDLSSQASIKQAAAEVIANHDHLDVLIHNAADFDISRKQALYTPENIESVWATNHIGPVVLTNALRGLLAKSGQGRILTVASKGLLMHPFMTINHADPEFRNAKFSVEKAYYHSKLAQVMYTYWLAKELVGSPICVNCIRVTSVKVDITRYPGISPFMKRLYALKSRSAISPEQMAQTYVHVATSPDLAGVTGKYFDEKNRPVKSSKYSCDPREIEQLMVTTKRFLQ